MATRKKAETDVLSRLEARQYLATDADIAALTETYVNSQDRATTVGSSYLKVLLAGVQRELGDGVEMAPKKYTNLTPEAAAAQRAALNTVHDRYYAIVTRVAVTPDIVDDEDLVQEERAERALARNRRTNFARTAKSALMAWLKVNGDLTELPVLQTTKAQLWDLAAGRLSDDMGDDAETAAGRRKLRLTLRRMLAHINEMVDGGADPQEIAVEVEGALTELARVMAKLGRKPTTTPALAVREHRPFQTPAGMFWPAAMEQTLNS
jgi:hypothetical protein